MFTILLFKLFLKNSHTSLDKLFRIYTLKNILSKIQSQIFSPRFKVLDDQSRTEPVEVARVAASDVRI